MTIILKTQRRCEGMARRDFIQTGLSALGGFGLVDLLRMQAASADGSQSARSKPATRCIFIWMDGGPSHHETFDTKPDAPAEIRGIFDPIRSNVSGLDVGEHIPKIAQIMDRVTVIRSITHKDPGHGGGNHYLTTGCPTPTPVACGARVSFHPSFGSVIAKERGSVNGLPPYIQFALPGPLRSGGPNFLGSKYAPFYISNNPNNPDFSVSDVTLPPGISSGRASTREALRRSVDQLKRISDAAANDPAHSMDSFYEQAVGLVTSPQAVKAFDLSLEPEKTRAEYGHTMVGQQCLLARRMIEAGAPFVTVQHAGWDHHGNIFPYLKNRYLPIFDTAFSALIRDMDQRGLLDNTLVLALGEFGRTPKINKNAGRDHWPSAMSVVAAGAGVPRGEVIGATDIQGNSPIERPLKVEDFAATLYTKMGIDPHKEYITPLGRPVPIVNGGQPIAELF